MPNGVEIHGKRLRVYFPYQGKKIREPLDLDATPENIAYAERKVAMIRHEIGAGLFDYAHHFPKSKHLQERTLGHYLTLWLTLKKTQVAGSTYRLYRIWAETRIRPHWGDRQADRIDYIDIEQWIRKDLADLGNKSIKEIIGILRQVYRLFRTRNPSAADPTEGVRIRLPDPDDPDPFTRAEIDAILAVKTVLHQELHLVRFLIWAGPRLSEAIALAWEDVDLKQGTVIFKRAKVHQCTHYKSTKTRRSNRKVELIRPARESLDAQWKITGNIRPEKIQMMRRDNRTIKEESVRFVFRRTNTGATFSGDRELRERIFVALLENASVRYRGPGQCRHTFASQMLTACMPPEWIAQQMGHTSTDMIRRHYGKWLQEDALDMISLAESRLGL